MRFLICLSLFVSVTLVFIPRTAWSQSAERVLEKKIENQLTPILGPDKVKAQVSGQHSPAQLIRKKVNQNPHVAAEIISKEIHNGKEISRSQVNYLYDQTEILTSQPGGQLQQRSVSIVYEGDPQISAEELETTLRTIAQIDPQRGDTLHIQRVQFDRSAFQALQAELEKARQGGGYWLYFVIGLMASLFGLGLGWFLARLRARKIPPTLNPWPEMPVGYSNFSTTDPNGII